MKGIGRLLREQSCPSRSWTLVDRASKSWRGPNMTPKALRPLQRLRRELLLEQHDVEKVIDETVTAAA